MEIHIPIYNEAALAVWHGQADLHGRSLEQEIASFINSSVTTASPAFTKAPHTPIEERFAAMRGKIRAAHGNLPDSVAMIREDRDA